MGHNLNIPAGVMEIVIDKPGEQTTQMVKTLVVVALVARNVTATMRRVLWVMQVIGAIGITIIKFDCAKIQVMPLHLLPVDIMGLTNIVERRPPAIVGITATIKSTVTAVAAIAIKAVNKYNAVITTMWRGYSPHLSSSISLGRQYRPGEGKTSQEQKAGEKKAAK